MVAEQQKELSSEVVIHTLAINYFDNAGVALFYERGLVVEPLNGELRRVAEEHSANKDKYYEQLLTQIVDRLLTPNDEMSFDKIIEQSIDPNHGSVRYFEEHGGSFSAWLHQLKSDTINAISGVALKLIEHENDEINQPVEERRKVTEQLIAEVLSEFKKP